MKKNYHVSKTSGVSYEAEDVLLTADRGDLSLAQADQRYKSGRKGELTDRPWPAKTDQDRTSVAVAALDLSEPKIKGEPKPPYVNPGKDFVAMADA